MKKYLIFLLILSFGVCLNVSANTYKISGTYVKMRAEATKNSEVLDTFNNGDVLVMLDYNAADKDDDCSMGWAHITYDGKNGYVCKNYVEEIILPRTYRYIVSHIVVICFLRPIYSHIVQKIR